MTSTRFKGDRLGEFEIDLDTFELWRNGQDRATGDMKTLAAIILAFQAVKQWKANNWPFKKVAFPGREVDWESSEALPEEKR